MLLTFWTFYTLHQKHAYCKTTENAAYCTQVLEQSLHFCSFKCLDAQRSEKDQMWMSALELTKTNDAPFNAIYSSAINNNVASCIINLRQTFEEEITLFQSWEN